MDHPSWGDTILATLSSCFACCSCSRASPNDLDAEENSDGRDLSDGARYAVRRARADELEGLLADTDTNADGFADDDAAADADAISLHSHLGPRGRRRPPPKTPRHISVWGWNLFGSGRSRRSVTLPGADGALHGASTRRENSTDALLASANHDSSSPHVLGEAEIARRAERRARKEMRRLARAVARPEAEDGDDFDGFPGNGTRTHAGIPAQFLQPTPDSPGYARAEDVLRARDDEDDADLDGVAYARRTSRSAGAGGSKSSGRSSNSGSNSNSGYERIGGGMPPAYTTSSPSSHDGKSKKKSSKSKRSTKPGLTSSTLASPSAAAFPQRQEDVHEEEFGDFASPGAFDAHPAVEFDGISPPRLFDSPAEYFDGTPGGLSPQDAFDGEEEVAREALPSPGLSRAFGRGGAGGGRGGAFLAGM
ncbi:hypothetical protein DFH07DRAFT_1065516 [Mycena maculata]|uniref:Uncharacterized protein n=1 Tax=Mycena maculata TaxID=230809 RepID=A0AAD7I1L8_9AGAR|nr:hypothetical protein DFH07DRAFT_1065516 [Mycena maculata]